MNPITKARLLRRNLIFPDGPELLAIKKALFKRKLNVPVRDNQFKILLGNLLMNQLSDLPTITPMKYFTHDVDTNWDRSGLSKDAHNTHVRVFRHLLLVLQKYPQYFLFTKADDSRRTEEMLQSKTRMATTILLLPQFNLDFGISSDFIRYSPLSDTTYVTSEVFNKIQADQKYLNEYFGKHEYAINGELMPAKVFIHYRENVSDEFIGGRIFGHPFTNAPQNLRPTFSINGDADISKLDYKSFSARCLYYLSNLKEEPPKDFYALGIDGVNRDTAKLCFMYLFGNGPYSETTGEIKRRFKSGVLPKGINHKLVISRLLELNPGIKDIPKNDSTLGQRKCETIESRILMEVIRYCDNRGIPIAPIHDGLFCRTKDVQEIQMAMEAIPKKIFEPILPNTHHINFITTVDRLL